MKDNIQIKEKDILWRLYKLYFELKGIPLEPPKTLCNYFWTAVSGLGLWPVERLSLLATLGVILSLFAILVPSGQAVHFMIQESYPGWTVTAFNAFRLVLFIAFMALLCLAMAVAFFRFDRFLDRHKKTTAIVGVAGIIAASTYLSIKDGQSVWTEAKHALTIMGFAGGIGVLLILIVLAVLKVGEKIPPERRNQMHRLADTIITRFKAWKRGMCPLVEAPKG